MGTAVVPVRRRAGVVLVEADRVALIHRWRAGQEYFVFPGGGIDADETAAEAAVREVEEELGLRVRLGAMVAEVEFTTPDLVSRQVYFWATRVVGGTFGSGDGPEMQGLYPPERGAYAPEWVPCAALAGLDVRPRALAAQLGLTPLSPARLVLRVHESR